MTIAIDVREALSPLKAGKGWYAFELVKEALPHLLKTYDTVKLVYAGTDVITNALQDGLSLEQKRRVMSVTFSGGPLWHVHVAQWVKDQPDLRYLSLTSAVVPALVPKQSVYMVHDLIVFLYRQEALRHDKKAWFLERLCVPRAVRKSSVVLAVSHATAQDVRQRFGRSVHAVITPGVHERTPVQQQEGAHESENAPERAGLREPEKPSASYIVSVGSLVPRKNHVALIRAYKELLARRQSEQQPGVDLVVIGQRLWGSHEVWQELEKEALFTRVNDTTWQSSRFSGATIRQLPALSAQERDRWVAHADVSVYPSLYEGFGMPVIEAMQLGVPVICSRHASLNDAAGDAALRVNTQDVEELATALARVLYDQKTRTQLVRRGTQHAAQFRWERSARLLARVLA